MSHISRLHHALSKAIADYRMLLFVVYLWFCPWTKFKYIGKAIGRSSLRQHEHLNCLYVVKRSKVAPWYPAIMKFGPSRMCQIPTLVSSHSCAFELKLLAHVPNSPEPCQDSCAQTCGSEGSPCLPVPRNEASQASRKRAQSDNADPELHPRKRREL